MISLNVDTKGAMRGFLRNKKNGLERAKAGMRAGALVIVNEAKRVVPVLTGTLKRGIHTEQVIDSKNNVTNFIGVSRITYARAIEFGSSKKAPDGYLRVSLDEKGDEAIREVRDALKKLF